jgi:hypothetical protein
VARRFVAVAFALVVGAGCAAIAGLGDPSPIEETQADGAIAIDGTPAPDGGAPDVVTVAPPIGYGSGSDGPVVVTDKRSVNEYAPLAMSAAAGARSITLGKKDATVTAIPVKAGDVLLLVQSATPGVKTAVATTPLETEVGTWELVHVNAVNGNVVDLGGPLTRSFSAPGAQAVRALQATTVDVGTSGSIVAPKWDGVTGGIIAILATDAVMLSGVIDASLSGHRAGRALQSSTAFYVCAVNEGLVDGGYAPRGEGFAAADAGYGGVVGGRGNLGNGGGGGDCHNAGGGGGGNGGRGGPGGQSWASDGSREVGGIGGAALKIPTGVSRLRFGGGGGAGEGDDNNLGNGGVGGGVIFVRAPKLTGAGSLNARGGGGNDGDADGAGGGGAGGTVHLDLAEAPSCSAIVLHGGNGGNVNDEIGPGGGGGGGVLFMKTAPSTACPVDILSGGCGKFNGAPRGAGPTDDKRDAGPFVGVVSTDLTP